MEMMWTEKIKYYTFFIFIERLKVMSKVRNFKLLRGFYITVQRFLFSRIHKSFQKDRCTQTHIGFMWV